MVGARGVLPRVGPVSTDVPCGVPGRRPEPDAGEGDHRRAEREASKSNVTPSVASPLLWAVTLAGVLFFFAVDFVLTRRPHAVKFREALGWTAFYLALPVIFGIFAWLRFGSGTAVDYFTGYLVEKALSVDNLFVFMLLIAAFAVPAALTQRVLLYGIAGALVLRGVYIAFGVVVVLLVVWFFLIFGGILRGT